MKHSRTFSLLTALMLALTLALTACGNGASPAAPASASTSAASTTDIAAPGGSAPSGEEKEIAGTIVGASMNNITIMTGTGETLDFTTTDVEFATVDGILEGDWVCITYVGEINGADTSGVQVVKVADNDEHVDAAASALTFTPANKTMFTTGPVIVYQNYTDGSAEAFRLDKGSEVEITGESVSGWRQLQFNGQEGYAFGDYFTEQRPSQMLEAELNDAAVTTVAQTPVYTTVNLRVRAEPNTSAQVYTVAKTGTQLLKTGTVGNWTQVLYNGVTAYVDSEYLTTSAPASIPTATGIPAGVSAADCNQTFYAAVNLKLHPTTTTDSVAIAVAPQGTALYITKLLDNHWAEVAYAGQTLYCVSQYLSSTPVQSAVTTSSTTFTDQKGDMYAIADVHIREQPSLGGQIIATMPLGTKIFRYGVSTDGKWSQVDYEGTALYCATQYLSSTAPTKDETGTQTNDTVTTTANLRMHTGQSIDSQILGTVPAGTQLQRVTVYSNGWSQVLYNSQYAYCATEYLK